MILFVTAKAYPSSSQHTKNWDKLAKEVDEEEKTENKEGDAALNDLFKKIYSDGSDEQKKAMVKSFVSTNRARKFHLSYHPDKQFFEAGQVEIWSLECIFL